MRKFETLEELYKFLNHFLKNIPNVFRITNNKLLNFLKSMFSKNTPGIFFMKTGFFSKTTWKSINSLWERIKFQSLIEEVTTNWLFRCGNKIVVLFLVSFGDTWFRSNIIYIYIIIRLLSNIPHNAFFILHGFYIVL